MISLAVLLLAQVAVPEVGSTISLLGLAIGGLVFLRRKLR